VVDWRFGGVRMLAQKAVLATADVSTQFPVHVFEVPSPSYYTKRKVDMRVASNHRGGLNYTGPVRLCPDRWKHIHTIYLVELGPESFYQAQSLTHHPHYTILRSELFHFNENFQKFKDKHSHISIKQINGKENYQDNFMLVINDFGLFPSIKGFMVTINDDELLEEVQAKAVTDTSRCNSKIDFGYASGQNLQRDTNAYGCTLPRLLEHTMEPVFLEIQHELSVVTDMVGTVYGLPACHRVDGINQRYAGTLHPSGKGIFPAWRAAWSTPTTFLQVHEDSLNDSRPLMSPVSVLSKIYDTINGPLRLTKIGYSRQSLYDSEIRAQVITPVIQEYKVWEENQSLLSRNVSTKLFQIKTNSSIPGVIEISSHLERSVGLSPYIHGTIHLQEVLVLNKQQCTAIVYHCITHESPFFFYSVYEDILLLDSEWKRELGSMTPYELGIWFHEKMWCKIEQNKMMKSSIILPQRHQPHNGVKPSDEKIGHSILNLLTLVIQLCALGVDDLKKNFYHSKAVAILMMSPTKGGCHGCGGLTSQTLLYTLSCLGIIPITLGCFGELAATDTARFLQQHYNLNYAEGRCEQFFNCLVACSPHLNPQQVENRLCKWTRWMKKALKHVLKADISYSLNTRYRDAIWPGQAVYEHKGQSLVKWTPAGPKMISPPAISWPDSNTPIHVTIPSFWDQSTRSCKKKILGLNRLRMKGRVTGKSDNNMPTWPAKRVISALPTPLELLYLTHQQPLYLSINNLLARVLEEQGSGIPNSRIVTQLVKGGGYQFAIRDSTDSKAFVFQSAMTYQHAKDCRVYGAVDYSISSNPTAFSKVVLRLIESKKGRQQIKKRDRDGETSLDNQYYVIHDNNNRIRSRRGVIAVVKQISPKRYIFAQLNRNFTSEEINYTYLDKLH
jgi:hypothetical protein